MDLRFTQIQCVPVPNVSSTQCHVFMYGLTADGELWFKRDNDTTWTREEMEAWQPDTQSTVAADV